MDLVVPEESVYKKKIKKKKKTPHARQWCRLSDLSGIRENYILDMHHSGWCNQHKLVISYSSLDDFLTSLMNLTTNNLSISIWMIFCLSGWKHRTF